ncbi:MAG: BamA/TamA family outer membrane protein [Bacteroidaceae bacterium]|nr:BamA/TamA family outer membrane protein [Bacteroidaceae bacterium]
MKQRIGYILMAMLFTSICGQAQETTSQELGEEEIIKTGWNIGILPVVGYDSDLGFQYGICSDIFHYSLGHYPQYDFKVNLEASRYTKGSSVLRSYGEFKNLIPEGKFFYDVTYFSAPKFEFYGLNGKASPYLPGVAYVPRNYIVNLDRSVDMKIPVQEGFKSALYWMSRSQFRAVVSMQKKISGALNGTVGLAYYDIKTGRIDVDKLSGNDEEKKEWYDFQSTLYDMYCGEGLIPAEEAEGGHVTQLKAGLTYDSRNRDSDPTRGANVELTFYAAPDFMDRTENYNHTNGGVLFMGSQYLPVVGDKLTLAYRLGAQYTLFGHVPFYFCNNMNSMFFRKMYTEGLGGNASVRGIHRNGVIGDGFVLLNTELRWRVLDFRLINQNWGVALNPFFDCGQVIQPHNLEQQQMYKKPIYSGNAEALHYTAGCGFKLVMNHNMVISFEAAKALRENDGDGLWTNIGFNYLF